MEQLSNHQQGQIPISIPIPIPIPINVSYGGHGHGHMIHHHHHEPAAATPHTSTTLTHNNHLIHSSTTLAAPPPPPPQNHIISSISMPTTASLDPEENPENEEHVNHVNNAAAYNSNKKAVNNFKYRECLKNHAAAIGGTATDGCGEFMPSGEEGTIEALNCSACNCHRNFHRKEIEGDHGIIMSASSWDNNANNNNTRVGRKILLGHHNVHKNMSLLSPEALGVFHTNHSRTAQQYQYPHHPHPHQMIMSYSNNMGMGGMMGTQLLPSESDEQDQDQDQVHGYGANNVGGVSRAPVQQHLVKKRFRTKFTQEQKEKMLSFAEKVGWKIQKQEESVVQSFCNEIGVKRRVLKVWMHNNKHNLAKNKSQPIPSTTAA